MLKRKTLLIVVNVDWFFISHRLPIAKVAVEDGWRVVVVGKDTGRAHEIEAHGIQFVNIPLKRSGTHIYNELKLCYSLFQLYKKYRPDVVHHITLKPIIYGSLIAKFLRIKGVVNAISGLGFYFTNERKGLVKNLIVKFLGYAFNYKGMAVIFQNNDDYLEFKNAQLIQEFHHIYFMKGVGVNLKKYTPLLPANRKEKLTILFPARMIWDKGIRELKKATEILKPKYLGKIQFMVCGGMDDDSKDAVSINFLNHWAEEGYVKLLGHQKNMEPVFQQCDIVVFPSYREGMPKALLEACATGKPIITTNAIGCKECVDEGFNGYKVPVKSVKELAEALEKLINSPEDRLSMGKYSREKAVKEFNEEVVIEQHLEIYNSLLKA